MAEDDFGIVEWADSGAMALTGHRSGAPIVAPARVARVAASAAIHLRAASARIGSVVDVDGPALLGERAAIAGFQRSGDVSVGGAARFVRSADGHAVLNLPRPEDVASLPALVGAAIAPDDWTQLAERLARMDSAEIVDRAAAVPGSVDCPSAPERELHRGGPRLRSERPLVVDLTSLWAGPLLTSLLSDAGARVIKVEGAGRHDGARRGPAPFFDLLNHGKEMVTVDFTDRRDRRFLRQLMSAADLVVEASRPRVMAELEIVPLELAAAGTSWLSITGYGRDGTAANRIGFGDDAAVAGGLFVAGDPPLFVADAVADPLTGLFGAAAASDLLAQDRASVIELPLARVAAWAAGPAAVAEIRAIDGGWEVRSGEGWVEVRPPRARPSASRAARAGEDDAAVRAEFGDVVDGGHH